MLLQIDSLKTYFDTPAGTVRAVDGVSFTLPAGRTLALVGESGCGKSLTALSIMRLIPPPGRIVDGTIRFHDLDLTSLRDRELRAIRGNRIAMIFQEPMTSLHPLLAVGEQIGEVVRLHRRSTIRATRERVLELLHRVGIPAPEQRVRDYPHQMSGGMRQRVMIAMALACEPELLIADEPTTALDVTVQAQILALLRDLQRRSGMALLFITHDLDVVARIAAAVSVMYAGRVVEHGPATEVLATPAHPYTQGLLRCTPRLTTAARRLPVIPGDVPGPLDRPPGCPFHPRCELGRDDPVCRTQAQVLQPLGPRRSCACWKPVGGSACSAGAMGAGQPV
jgi:peptide/nickel transport system ATP-binding protein/oligopeptide transport system ATP-binding protein